MTGFSFPDGFAWGAATSAYQIEGSPLADGAGPSIWHRFAHTPGLVRNGDTGDVACDHYGRWEEDVDLMRELGLNAYRFSVSWSRVLPEGRGRVNQAGLDFYRRLVDGLLEAGIRPFVTLYHWDLPAALDDLGGWLNPDVAGWFADYAQVLFAALDDRVRHWTTINEPWVVTDGGYLEGALAPGHRSLFEAPRAAHHLLRAHAEAVRAYRADGAHEVGLVVNLVPVHPASERPEDLAAASRLSAYINQQFLDPVFLGRYPERLREIFGPAWPEVPEEELAAIREPIDFLGVNYYTRRVVRDAPNAPPLRVAELEDRRRTRTETGWEVDPQGLTDTLRWVAGRYGSMPLYITENGAAFYDPPTATGGRVDDPLRVHYLRSHLKAAHSALDDRAGDPGDRAGDPPDGERSDDRGGSGNPGDAPDDPGDAPDDPGDAPDDPGDPPDDPADRGDPPAGGVDLRGYFVWSLLDNFEWSHGYSKRFGIVHVDYDTLRRTPKASAEFYARVARSNGTALGEPAPPAPWEAPGE